MQMKRRAPRPTGLAKRSLYSLGSGAFAFVLIGMQADETFAWGTWELWFFSTWVVALGFYLYRKVD